MKKVISFLLCICFLFGICPVNVSANEAQTKYLQVSVNDKVQIYECLWDAKEIFCSVEDLGEMTNYDWTQMEDGLAFQFYREYENDNGDYNIELQTSVLIEINDNKKTAEIDAMGESYSVNCYVKDEEVFLPLEKLLYLLHAEWVTYDDVLCVVPMPLTILDFMAIHSTDLAQIESTSEDVLVDTGWLFSDNKWGQAVYSTIAEVFNDFDGKIFMLWWPGEGHVETAECYENAILQLAKEDKEFIGQDVQSDAIEVIIDSIFSMNSESTNKIQNIISIPSNIDDLVQSVPDAVSVLEDLSETFPNIKISEKVKNVSEKIRNGQIDSSFLAIPELKSKADELEKIGDGLAILQCVWNAYDTANRVEGWDEEYLSQLDVLANYNNPGYINENVVDYVRSSAQRLIDSYSNPTQAAADEALQSTMGLLLSKTFDESPFGKVFSIMEAVGNCYGTFDMEIAETYDVYSELSVVTFSIKIEQLVRELFRYEDILTTTKKLTRESIEEARDQLMLYLRLNLRNKAQLYNLNLRGNDNKNWSETEEAKKLHDEIVKVYAMLAELIETKDYDSLIILDKEISSINSENLNSIAKEEQEIQEKLEKEIVGSWRINSEKTMSENGVSMIDIFGTSYQYGSIMSISDDGNFSYYVGSGNGGEGTWTIKDNQLNYSIVREDDQTIENGIIEMDNIDSSESLLRMKINGYIIYWEKSDETSIFQNMPSNFEFASGVGAWSTELSLNSDGSFTGYYHDSDMGDSNDAYPDGTVYICNFNGKFTTPTQINDYTYSMKLESLQTEGNSGEEYYENNQRFVYSEPYGLENANELLIYTPGSPISELPEDLTMWLNTILTSDDKELPCFVIFSVNDQSVFVGYDDVKSETDSSQNTNDDNTLIENARSQVLEHYTELWNPKGSYTCFDAEDSISGDEVTFVLRYAMSDEEAEEKIANGGTPSANTLVTLIIVNLNSGEVYDVDGYADSWYLEF